MTATPERSRANRFHLNHRSLAIAVTSLLISATSSLAGDAKNAQASIPNRSFSGMASFYGNESGNKTASGQRFNQNAMTAAHRSLPFGTKLKVTRGSRSVVVTINDRGPFIKGRVLDLSTGAARVIGLTSQGVGKVVAEIQ